MLGNFDFVIIWRFYWFMEKLKNWLLFFLWRTKRTGLKIHKRLRMYSENWRETYLRGCVLIKVGLKVCSENLFQLGLRSWSMYLQEANCTDFLGIFNNSCFVDQFFCIKPDRIIFPRSNPKSGWTLNSTCSSGYLVDFINDLDLNEFQNLNSEIFKTKLPPRFLANYR